MDRTRYLARYSGSILKWGGMSDPEDLALGGMGAQDDRTAAGKLADQLKPMVEVARSWQLDFLAYLLGMALKEARRIASGGER
jgi:hypothetical protein